MRVAGQPSKDKAEELTLVARLKAGEKIPYDTPAKVTMDRPTHTEALPVCMMT